MVGPSTATFWAQQATSAHSLVVFFLVDHWCRGVCFGDSTFRQVITGRWTQILWERVWTPFCRAGHLHLRHGARGPQNFGCASSPWVLLFPRSAAAELVPTVSRASLSLLLLGIGGMRSPPGHSSFFLSAGHWHRGRRDDPQALGPPARSLSQNSVGKLGDTHNEANDMCQDLSLCLSRSIACLLPPRLSLPPSLSDDHVYNLIYARSGSSGTHPAPQSVPTTSTTALRGCSTAYSCMPPSSNVVLVFWLLTPSLQKTRAGSTHSMRTAPKLASEHASELVG